MTSYTVKGDQFIMLYIQEYCIAAALGTLTLAFMYFLKRNYATRSNRIFLAMIGLNLFSSLLNILSIHTISYPWNYSPFVRTAVNLGYLMFYNLLACTFLLYADSLTRIPRFRKPVALGFGAAVMLTALLIFLSPFTRWIAYFDDSLTYRHGVLHPLLYIISYSCMAWSVFLFVRSARKFSRYQLISLICFILGIAVTQIFQTVFPRYVINNFVITLALFFLFIAFENQAYYLFRKTQCFNRYAFISTIRRLQKRRIPYQMTALRLDHMQDSPVMTRRSSADQLATLMAERLYHSCPGKVFALSNDCFAVVMETRSRHFSTALPDKVQACFAEPFTVTVREEPESIQLSPQIQAMNITEHFPAAYELLEHFSRADSFLHRTISDDEIDTLLGSLRREQMLLRLIDDALKNQKFQVWYQPILDLSTGETHSAEALIRLIDEKEGFISPEDLIRTAEKYGRINAVGLYVFEAVCRTIRDRGLIGLGMEMIEINLSPRQIRNPNLAEQMLALIHEYNVPPQAINLEITETAEITLAEKEQMAAFMNRLKEEGISFSLDDYGSGFATISSLLTYPVDLVKFDRDILWHAMKNTSAMTVLETSLSTVLGIGKKALVEGVETEEMKQLLVKNRSNYLQGYLFSRPLPEEDFIQFIRKHEK